MVTLFTYLIILQFAIIISHDLIDIPGWVHGSQVQALIGKRKVWLAILANSVFPGIAAGFAILESPQTRVCARLLGHLLCRCALIGSGNVVCPLPARSAAKAKNRIPEDVCRNSPHPSCACRQSTSKSFSYRHPRFIRSEFLPGFSLAFS